MLQRAAHKPAVQQAAEPVERQVGVAVPEQRAGVQAEQRVHRNLDRRTGLRLPTNRKNCNT